MASQARKHDVQPGHVREKLTYSKKSNREKPTPNLVLVGRLPGPVRVVGCLLLQVVTGTVVLRGFFFAAPSDSDRLQKIYFLRREKEDSNIYPRTSITNQVSLYDDKSFISFITF